MAPEAPMVGVTQSPTSDVDGEHTDAGGDTA